MINGYVIQEKNEKFPCIDKNQYFGLGKYSIWPLDFHSDYESRMLSSEAENKWLLHCDGRPLVIPDYDYIERYIGHCEKLGLDIICFLIESDNSIYQVEDSTFVFKELGYDYVDVDMSTSCLYEDMNSCDIEYRKYFSCVFNKLNKYMLFNSIEHMNLYLQQRKNAFKRGFQMETYFQPIVVKISLCQGQSGDGSMIDKK